MKNYLLLLMLSAITTFSYAQGDCEYVDNNNQIGGFDCAAVSIAPFTADSYQWLNCDDAYSEIAGATDSEYNNLVTSTNIALVVDYLGCIDTSDCYFVCTVGLDELMSNEIRKVEKIVDLTGRSSEDKPNTLLIYYYSDGSIEKRIKIE